MKLVRPCIHTLSQRLVLILGVCMLGCFILVVAVAHTTLKAAERDRIETTMRADLLQLSDLIDAEYYTLVQMSQQMTPEGIIGETVASYLRSREQFERISLSSSVSTSINTMIFSHENVSLVSYLRFAGNQRMEDTLFSTMPVEDAAAPGRLETLTRTASIGLQAPHESLNALSNKQAISLTRPVYFGDGTSLTIYLESYLDPAASLAELSHIRNVPYFLLEVSESGRICYSTCPGFAPGGRLGPLDGYQSVRAQSKFGFTHLLLVPQLHYNQLMLRWKMGVAGMFLLALALTAFTAILLFTLIYRPLQTLARDMQEVGRGNLDPVQHTFHMDEFDSLFRRFDEMKREVADLLENSRRQEKEKQQLEIDKLYYQINPHFLMNALNSVHWMAVANRQPEIDRFIFQLNYILGYSLGKTDKRATLRTELKSLELYLGLQKERYDFEVRMDVEPGDYLDYPCARLILQPLAENAVCHNLNEFGTLWVSIHPVPEGLIEIVIRDDGRGIQQLGDGTLSLSDSPLNQGIGLRYVQLSLESFYGGAARIELQSEEGEGTTVRLLLPVQKGDTGCTTC